MNIVDESLCTVELVKHVKGQGLTAFCGFPDPAKAVLRAGDPVVFALPDGNTFWGYCNVATS